MQISGYKNQGIKIHGSNKIMLKIWEYMVNKEICGNYDNL